MKKILIIFLLFTALMAQDYVSYTNGIVGIVVDKGNGQFAIGKIEGGGVSLIEGYPDDPHYTRLCVKVEDMFFCNEPGIGDEILMLRDSAEVHDNTVSIEWNLGANRVWEKFTTIDEDSLRGFFHIEYLFYNDSPDSVIAGFSEYMNIVVDDCQAPTIVVPGEIIDTEIRYIGEHIPAYCTFFSDYGDSNSHIAQLIPFGREELYMDMLILSDVEYLHPITWEYMPITRPIDNLATFLRWSERTIAPFEFYVTAHYYGIGYPDAGIGNEPLKIAPMNMIIGAPYPNPTNGAVSFKLDIFDFAQEIEIDILDISGRTVRKIHSGKMMPETYYFKWNLKDTYGHDVEAGVYLLTYSTVFEKFSRKVIVVR